MRKWVAISLFFVLVIGGYSGYKLFTNNTPAVGPLNTSIVGKGNIQVNVNGTGKVTLVDKQIIKPNSNGTIKTLNVSEGTTVDRGQIIATFEANDLSNQIEQEKLTLERKKLELADAQEQEETIKNELLITSPADGNLISLNVEIGDNVQSNSIIGYIQDAEYMTVTVPFNSSQIKNMKMDQEAEVFLLGSFSTINGTVIEIDRLGKPDTGGAILHDVTVKVKGKISSDSSAQIKIKTEQGIQTSLKYGTFSPSEKTAIKAKRAGTVSKIYIDKQAYIKKGAKIALLESDSDYSSTVEKLHLDIEQSNQRLQSYYEDEIIAPITAPINGEIATLYIKAGDQVNTNTVIGEMANYSDLQLVIAIDELDIPKVNIGQIAEISIDALPDKKFAGEVVKIAKEGTPNNGISTFDVTLEINDGEGIKPGMTAQADIIVNKKQNVLLVPIEAVQERQGNKFVIIPSEQTNTQQNKKMRPVKVGIHNEDFIEILEGLQEGDSVVIPTIQGQGTGANQQRGSFGGMGGFGGNIRPGTGGR